MENQVLYDVPVLLILFNRPQHARQVIEALRIIKPVYVFVAIDGARDDKPQDVVDIQKCLELVDGIDWPCTITKLVRTKNLGCKMAVSSAITWFFDQVEAGVILEDDCLPNPTFFNFCKNLLHRYQYDYRIMHIGGANLYDNLIWGEFSYFFSCIPHIWGWATWRRAWALYDVEMTDYPQFKRSDRIRKLIPDYSSRSFWERTFDSVYAGNIDTWDFQWVYALWQNQGLSIIPNQNLISNIGFDEDATHTKMVSEFSKLPTVDINADKIIHPKFIVINDEAVKYAFAKFYQVPSIWEARLNRIKRILAFN